MENRKCLFKLIYKVLLLVVFCSIIINWFITVGIALIGESEKITEWLVIWLMYSLLLCIFVAGVVFVLNNMKSIIANLKEC